ncbi:hypothetical protein CY0110_15797 [Crocosphaera chwakensis CCY0110]|uniref:Uncharacterized protein n=1 Tax=Crocosphaera chwakensis CCY0110 TaxID=391612 RepID=A3IHJ1_9CHRO|nr:hypothetical protein CY0110_15797 [Crocosphaera chwakensis CCY0110]
MNLHPTVKRRMRIIIKIGIQ